MRSTRVAADDLTTRARIRDAAIDRFGRDGFDTGLRTVAQDAGVSAALVLHHFGSKDGLRRACDEHVLATIAEHKQGVLVGAGGPQQMLLELAEIEGYAPLVGYVMRSLLAGGTVARHFFDQFLADAERYLAEGVAAGTIRPSRDEASRARLLTLQGMGGFLLQLTLEPPDDPAALAGFLRGYVGSTGLAAMELFTQGLLTDRRMLDAYLMYVTDPPADAAPADAPSADAAPSPTRS